MLIDNPKILEFFEFIYDRQLVYYNKEVLKSQPPWTADPHLSKYNFCNVYRELDKGTKYLINITNKITNEEKLFFNIVIYRIFNIIGLFETVFDGYQDPNNFDFKKAESLLDEAVKRQSIFNTAYIVTQMPYPHKNYRRGTKHPQFLMTIEWLANEIVNNQFMAGFKVQTPELTMEKLQSIPLVGPFLAGQIMVDLTYTDIVPWNGCSFCIIGPGAKTGIVQILGHEPDYKGLWNFCEHLFMYQPEYFRMMFEKTGKNWKEIAYKDSLNGYPFLSFMDIQHDLCEFRKYNQWSTGQGKRKYYKWVGFDPKGSSF